VSVYVKKLTKLFISYLPIFFCYLLLKPFEPGVIMDMHAVAGVAVLLILAAVSAYRDALRNDPMSKMSTSPIRFPQVEEPE
jgi:uncharacterized membrane protein